VITETVMITNDDYDNCCYCFSPHTFKIQCTYICFVFLVDSILEIEINTAYA